MTSEGTAVVKCVAKIPRDARKPLISFAGGLTITKRHPIRLNGEWTLPCQAKDTTQVANPSGFVYNFVLDSDHIVLVNGIECVTWGHGLTSPMVKHAFYGTDAIIRYLSTLPGYSTGFVTLPVTCCWPHTGTNGLSKTALPST